MSRAKKRRERREQRMALRDEVTEFMKANPEATLEDAKEEFTDRYGDRVDDILTLLERVAEIWERVQKILKLFS